MPDDKMKQGDREKDMGASRREENYGKQTPGRSKQDDEQYNQRSGRQGTTGREMDDEDIDTQKGGRSNQPGGGQQQGGQNR